ncbi:caspase-3-like [Ciona intestinalis]
MSDETSRKPTAGDVLTMNKSEVKTNATLDSKENIDAIRDSSDDSYIDDDVKDHFVPTVLRQHMLEYYMKNERRGTFVVFNQENFDRMNHSRKGSEADVKMLVKSANKLGFEDVRVLKDQTTDEIRDHLQELSYQDHSKSDCFVCVVLSHGESDGVLYTKDGDIHLKEILDSFKASRCPSLAGKPKLFFIQACRGEKRSTPVEIEYKFDVTDSAPPEEETTTVFTIPAEADFLIAHATPEEFCAWRNRREGSRFIKALCGCLDLYAGDDIELLQILTVVNHHVSHGWDGGVYKYEKSKQIPSITTQLTARLFFTKKSKNNVHQERAQGTIKENESANAEANDDFIAHEGQETEKENQISRPIPSPRHKKTETQV